MRPSADRYQVDWAGSASEVEQECGLQECGLTERRLLLCTLRVPAAERLFSTAGTHKGKGYTGLSQAAPPRITYPRTCAPSQYRRTDPTQSCTVERLE